MESSNSSLHLLSIDFGSAPSSLRAVLELSADDVEHWIRRARMAGVPLVVVCGPESIDLYSSEAGHHAAFRPLLQSLWALGRHLEGFDRVRTREAFGHAVVRHLLRQAAGLESTEHGVSYSRCIAKAHAQATRFGTLSVALGELFELASDTAQRSETETELSSVTSTRASRQLEALGAERIMEEQLVAFQAASERAERASAPPVASTRPPVTSTRPPLASTLPPFASTRPPVASTLPPVASTLPPSRASYAADEPNTGVRMRVTPFQNWLPLSTRKSS
jgi:hypothetical protein